jgi:hypothetical protein
MQARTAKRSKNEINKREITLPILTIAVIALVEIATL